MLGGLPYKGHGERNRMKDFIKSVLKTFGLLSVAARLRDILIDLKIDVCGPHKHQIEFYGRVVDLPVFDAYTKWMAEDHSAPNYKGWYEPSLTQLLEKLMPDHNNFLDVGSHLGYFSVLFASVEGKYAYAIELDPNNYKKQQKYIGRSGSAARITSVNIGFSNEESLVEMPLGTQAACASSLARSGEKGAVKTKPVHVVTIDNFLQQTGFAPTLLKIDVEGFEYQVLEGAKSYILNKKPSMIIEIHTSYIERYGHTAKQIFEELHGQGYHLYAFEDHRAPTPSKLVQIEHPLESRNYCIFACHHL